MSKNILIDAHDKMYQIVQEAKKEMDHFIEKNKWLSPLTGETLTSWEQLQKEMETVENEIKKEIKSGYTGFQETEYFVIQKTTTYEYDPIMLRSLIPDESEFYIQVKESVNKAEVDKAVKQGVILTNLEKALREKSTSISFIDKSKIAEKEVKEVAV